MKTVVLCLVSVACVAVGSGCAPDSSVGSDTVPGAGAGAAGSASSQGGSGTSGAASMPTAGASGSPAAVAGSGGSDTPVGGSGGSVGAMAGSGGTSGSGVVGGAGAGAGAGNAMGGSAGQGGPSLCPVAGTTLCDGFEGDAPGAGTSAWKVSTAMGTMVVDTAHFYRGKKSMNFSTPNSAKDVSAYIVTSKIFTGTTKATNNAFWGRYFILSGVAAAATYSQSHVVFGGLADAGNTSQFHFVGGSRGKLQAEIQLGADLYTDSMKTPAATDPAFPLAADGWQCWEWQVTADDSYDFYINGTEVPEMKITAGKSVMNKMAVGPLPIFGTLSLGWESFGGGSPISGWIDEVAIGPNRIGCGS
jgi:hypothetical protein